MQKYLLLLLALCGSGCATLPEAGSGGRAVMARDIAAEAPGDYFIGRRYAKPPYRFWGYIRRPGQPWNSAVLVVLNENRKLAPDRAEMNLGADANFEYRLHGFLSGDKIYELQSDAVYPEFVLTGYELVSTHPAPIFPSQLRGTKVKPGVIEKPL